MQYALLTLLRLPALNLIQGRLLFPALALGGLLLLMGCATSPYQKHTKRGFEYLKKWAQEDSAVYEFREAVHLKPNEAEAHHNLAFALEDQGSSKAMFREAGSEQLFEEAIMEYREAIRLKPGWAMAHCLLGFVLLYDQHRIDSALVEFREALRLKPGFDLALSGIRNCFGMKISIKEYEKKPEEEIAVIREAISLFPKDEFLYRRWVRF